VQFPSFELAARGFGAFPSLRSPRVVWVGLFPAAPLQALHEAVERKLEGAAPPDGKRFSPHLTIARLDGTPGPAVREWIAAREPFATEEWTAAAFSLYASTLAPSGAIHRELERYPLEPANRTRE
jgi:2'-5' RNA ligase